jgi:2-polyprenyl-3-methyl-5-hydroxy-6-metoxy-1,4-benzoquinol methylase
MPLEDSLQTIGCFHFDCHPPHSCAYLVPALFKMLAPLSPSTRVLDVGCGNGAIANEFLTRGCHVVGIDVSQSGIEIARRLYAARPNARFEIMEAGTNMLEHLREAPFDIVLSTEVIEHLYDPESFARGCFNALRPGGSFLCSTPYHGYLKNLTMALTGALDRHFCVRDLGGHIKFWSRSTLSQLFYDVGFRRLQFRGAGRAPYIWKSMILRAEKPDARALRA